MPASAYSDVFSSFSPEDRKKQIAPKTSFGYTPEEQRGMKVATAAPIVASFGAAGEELRNQALRTGSNTALAPALQKFAQAKGMTLAPALAGLQQTFAEARRGDEAAATEREFSVSEAEKNRGLEREIEAGRMGLAEREFEAANPPWWKGAIQGGLGSVGGVLGDIGKKAAGSVLGPVVGKAAGAAAGATAGAALPAGVAGLPGIAAQLPSVASVAAPGTVAGGGGLGASLAGLATNPVTLAIAGVAGGILLGKKVFGIGDTHEKADEWVQGNQNVFDQYMRQVADAERSGMFDPGTARQARIALVAQYLEAAKEFAARGGDQRKVIDQAINDPRVGFRAVYGDPSQYGVRF